MADYYALQPAFTGGEISEEVASRVDIEKYQLSLLKAENVIIKPYGGLSKRAGTKFVGKTKYANKQAVLVRFNKTSDFAYNLEFGDKYVRVWDGDTYTNIELVTPFSESDLKYLRITQSADTMFICSRRHPVQVLKNNGIGGWSIDSFVEDYPYFDQSLGAPLYDGRSFDAAGQHTFIPKISGEYTIEIAGGGGGGDIRFTSILGNKFTILYGGNGDRKVIKSTLTANQSYGVVVGGGGQSDYSHLESDWKVGGGDDATPYEVTSHVSTINPTPGGQSSFNETIAYGGGAATATGNGSNSGSGLGGGGGYVNTYSDRFGTGWTAVNGSNGYVRISHSGNNMLTPSAIRGDGVTITATKDSFAEKQVGSYIKLYQQMPSDTKNATNGTTQAVSIGSTWKVISRGTWSGTLTLQRSSDGTTWKEYRKWSSANDNNVSEGGAFDEYTYLRAVAAITSGTCTVELTGLPYNHEGYAKIVEYISSTQIKVNVKDAFGSVEPTENYSFSVWSDFYGYPSCACFFQDRLVFAGNAIYPYMIWMSRTGDYYSFKVDKAEGTVTDDSAVSVPVISRELFQINHLVPAQDLIIMTNGNEWIISGDSVVTPTSVVAKMQTSRGSNECEPQFIGNRAIYVQRRGGTVRDMGYSFEQDNYSGDDLTQLAKHLVGNYDLVDSTFAQEPHSIVYFVRSDGALLCLTYIREQKVFAWSVIKTEGAFESINNIQSADNDNVYTIVKRNINGEEVRYIERFEQLEKNCFLDCAELRSGELETTKIYLEQLKGMTVDAVADGRVYTGLQVDADGVLAIEAPARVILAGLKYVSKVEQPNFEIQSKDGSLQGRKAHISSATLRLRESLGGEVGIGFEYMDELPFYEEFEASEYKLFSGDKEVTIPGEFSKSTKLCIRHDKPLPFNLNAIVRCLTFGG